MTTHHNEPNNPFISNKSNNTCNNSSYDSYNWSYESYVAVARLDKELKLHGSKVFDDWDNEATLILDELKDSLKNKDEYLKDKNEEQIAILKKTFKYIRKLLQRHHDLNFYDMADLIRKLEATKDFPTNIYKIYGQHTYEFCKCGIALKRALKHADKKAETDIKAIEDILQLQNETLKKAREYKKDNIEPVGLCIKNV